MKHAGLHWANGACDRETLAGYPGSAFLLCSPEARWHYDWIRTARPDATVIWRAIPRDGKKPAHLGYQAKKVATECLTHWDDQPHGGDEHFLPLNELSLNYERGDDRDDFSDLETRYSTLASLLAAMAPILKSTLGPDVKLHFPAWAAGHGEWEHLDRWKWATEAYDVIHFHAYGSLDSIVETYWKYRDAFPEKPLFLGEWNSGVNPGGPDFRVLGVTEEREILKWLALVTARDPLFLGATYFIYRWYDGWAENSFDVDGNAERTELFMHPPDVSPLVVVPPSPTPPPPPAEAMEPLPVYSYDDTLAIGIAVADELKLPHRLVIGCGIAESNLEADARRPSDPALDQSYWPDVSGGAWQQTIRYDPDYRGGDAYPGQAEVARVYRLQCDAWRAARVAARQLKTHLQEQAQTTDDDLRSLDARDDLLLGAMYRYNWPGGHGKPYSAQHQHTYTDGLSKASAILGIHATTPPTETDGSWFADFDRDEPMPIQKQGWTCSAETMAWISRSLGVEMTATRAVELLGDAINPDDGLRLGSGVELAATLRGLGYTVTQIQTASFDDVVGLSYHGPVGIGLHKGEGHWVGVRGYDPEHDLLEIANSAPGFLGVYSVLTRAGFDEIGYISAVGVEAPHAPYHSEEDPAVIASLQQRIDELEKEKADLVSTLGYLTGDVAKALASSLSDADTALENARKSLDQVTAQHESLQAAIDTLKRHAA